MFNLSPERLLVIAVIALILLGPDKLPQVARQAGGAWRALTEFRHRMESEVRSNLPDLPSTTEIARLARSPSALLDHLSSMSDDDAAVMSDDHAALGEDHAAAPMEGAGEPANENGPVANGAGSNGAGSNGSDSPGAVEGAAEEPLLRSAPVAPSPRPRGSAGSEPIVSGDPTLN